MISKLKKLLKKIIKSELIKFTGMLLILLFTSIKAPKLHLDYLRAKVAPKVVKLMNQFGAGGTGFYVNLPSGNTAILTNKHVCGVTGNTIAIVAEDKSYKLRNIISRSNDHDLCLVEAPEDINGLSLSTSKPEIGDTVAIIGHPHLTPLAVAKGTYNGETTEMIMFMNMLELPINIKVGWTDAAAYPGNSGSPVVDFYGNVVGVLFAGSAAHVNMIVPLTSIKAFLKDF